jgi:ABC-type lipoprotein export system ATPase subunit
MTFRQLNGVGYVATSYQMITAIEISNFRCFERLLINDIPRVNVVVGDNGSGKTALLEAIYLALSTTPSNAVKLRQWRGLATNLSGTIESIDEAMFGAFFRFYDMDRPVSITLRGSGPEARSFYLSRGTQAELIPLGPMPAHSGTLQFDWTNSDGAHFLHQPQYTEQGIVAGPTVEKLPDFHFFAANIPVGAREIADAFTRLSRKFSEADFLDVFRAEYPWIKGMNIESVGGQSILHATVEGSPVKLPLTETSGAVNRMVSILLAIASRQQNIVLIDEVENGIYYKHHLPFWRALLNSSRRMDAQLFITTHNDEWLRAMATTAGEQNADVGFWRIRRSDGGQPLLDRMSLENLKDGIELGVELR